VFGEPEPVSEEPRLRQTLFTAKQPAARLMPFAKVEEAVVEAAKMVSALRPPEKVEVERSPLMVVVAVVPT
jgi:hypothetical protein